MTDESHDPLTALVAHVLRKEFDLTLEDFAKTQELLIAQRSGPRRPLRSALLIWITFSVISFVQIGENDHRILVAMIVTLPVFALAYAFIRWAPTLAWRYQLKVFYGPGPFSCVIEIGEKLITIFDDFEQRFPWHSVRKLENHPDELRIFVAKFALARIPVRVFDSESEKRQWIEVLEQKTGLSFS